MEERKAVWYSIIRYSPDNLSGEVINVGILLHNFENQSSIKFSILEENSSKIRSIIEKQSGINLYKSYKDILEYYLSKSKETVDGSVGEISIGSYYSENFLNNLYEYFKNKKLTITKPNFAFTSNVEILFKGLFEQYVGSKYLDKTPKTLTAKKFVKEYFQTKKLLDRKVKSDIELNPLNNLNEFKIKIDFTFKNGVWNYMQAVPNLYSSKDNSDWLAKTEYFINNLNETDFKVHLLYKASDFTDNKSIYKFFNYLTSKNMNIAEINVDEKDKINKLCDYIEEEAEDLEGYKVS
ncbi:DUF3037 domain-containing protein [Senegalia massiliensis]|uniref:DUF3037 domain-containing protein n=1 Tax=Senegalia massiliensis TaxID=1720316 RepID=A0A845QUQ6_9CLOT|nr:DUF3037 domain-containing protein [Senegalia massiliensis]NBI05236.1 DUF3037 domain-containing protein [Senegalia massiliensis]